MDISAIGKILGGNFDAVAGDGALALTELALPKDAAILDVGTGKGNFAIFLASQGYRVLTGEPSTDQSRYARQEWAAAAEKVGVLDRIRFEHFEADRMPFEMEAFDAVFFFGVLHHIDEAVRRDVLREALRVAKANGAVVFFEPRKEMLERIWVDDPGHPLAAKPGEYLRDESIREKRIEGTFMDIFVYRKDSEKENTEFGVHGGHGVKDGNNAR
jgi:SAM-dependent methyltransferase